MWQRLSEEKRQDLGRLLRGLKYGGHFGSAYVTAVWGATAGEADRRLSALELIGLKVGERVYGDTRIVGRSRR